MYAQQLKKPIVLLVMQQEFEKASSGWLKEVLAKSNKNSIDFTQLKPEEAIEILKNEIENPELYKVPTPPPPPPPATNYAHLPRLLKGIDNTNYVGPQQPKKQQVHDWSAVEAKSWFLDNKIDAKIISLLSPCDGEVLEQLYKVKCEAPEFFYQSIGANNKEIDLKALVRFSVKLSELFEKQ